MKRLLTLLAALALTLLWAGSTLAADELLPHSGRVLISLGGDIDLDAFVAYLTAKAPVAPGPRNRITRTA